MEAGLHRPVHSIIESLGLATTKGHVGDRALVRGLASGGELGLGSLGLLRGLVGRPDDTANDVGH